MTGAALIDGFNCPVTAARDWEFIAAFDAPPEGETDFGFTPYHRALWRSRSTAHIVNLHEMDLSQIYAGDYWDRTYGDGKIDRVFDKIMSLPPEKSDNRARVAFVNAHGRAKLSTASGALSLLDVGSGLAVFPAAMKDAGWAVSALDPDPRAAAHAESRAGATGIAADFMTAAVPGAYDLVSFNKVLEHVPDPVAMLARSRSLLNEGGLCYVELPDAEGALADSPAREEFFIEHYCAFSAISYAMLAAKAGFRVDLLERIVEPSGKYTLRGLLRVADKGA